MPTPRLPDIEDEIDDSALRARMQPLAERVVPAAPSRRLKKPKQVSVELLLPERVARELKTRAAAAGRSSSRLVLELLRKEGYPVLDADFIDLRREGRGR